MECCFQEEAALRLVDPSLRTSEYRPINIFINFYSGNLPDLRNVQIILKFAYLRIYIDLAKQKIAY